MRIYMSFIVYSFFMLVLTSCSVPLACKLYNNTGAPLEVIKYESGKVLQAALIDNKSSHSFNGCVYGDYQVEIGEMSYNFEVPSYSIDEEKYVEYEGALFWGKRVVRAQVEPSGKIYLLQKEEQFPLTDLSSQPEGYPIVGTLPGAPL